MTQVSRAAALDELSQLKSLLASGDSEKFEQIEQRVDQLLKRAGDDEALRLALKPVLAKAIADIEQSNPKPLSRALSPFIVASIRREIANSRDDMVEILYPITGRLVTAAVKNAMDSVAQDINRRVDALTSTRMLGAKYKSWRTGRPVAEILMGDNPPARIVSALLIDRDTGELIEKIHAPDTPHRDHENLLTGLLAALSNLTEEVFTGSDDQLRTLDLNGREFAFRRSVRRMLVVEFIGSLEAQEHRYIDEHFAEIVEAADAEDGHLLQEEMQALLAYQPSREPEAGLASSRWKGKLLFASVLLAALAWLGYHGYHRHRLDQAEQRVQTYFDAALHLRGYPASIEQLPKSRSLRVTGLLPVGVNQQEIEQSLQSLVGDVPLESRFTAVTDAQTLRNVLVQLNALQQRDAQFQQLFGSLDERIKASLPFDESGRYLGAKYASLESLLRGQSIRFSEGVSFAQPELATAYLRRLSDELQRTGAVLRIIGYADAMGSTAQIESAALARARFIQTYLSELGVADAQLRITQRGAQAALTLEMGSDSGNRRVEFERVVELPSP